MHEQLVDPPKELTVESLARDHGALTLHAITDKRSVGQNSLLMTEHSDFHTKVEACLSFEPTLSASLVSPSNPDRRTRGSSGLIIIGGDIRSIHNMDAGTVAKSLDSRDATSHNDSIETLIDSQDDHYNEITVANPSFGGLFWRPKHERGAKEPSDKVPEYLIEVSRDFDLPIYVMDNSGQLREVVEIDEQRTFKLKDSIDPSDLQSVDIVGKDIVQDSLLERGVFKLATRERELVSKSEQGRLAYVAEVGIPNDMLGEHFCQEFYMTWPSGLSSKILIKKNVEGSYDVTQRRDGESLGEGIGTERVFRAQNLQDVIGIGRRSYLTGFSVTNDPEDLALINAPTFDEEQDMTVDFLDIAERNINAAQRVIENADRINPRATFNLDGLSASELIRQHLESIGFFLYGFAKQARSFGDTQRAERAEELAESLVSKELFEDVLSRRAKKIGNFCLTRADF